REPPDLLDGRLDLDDVVVAEVGVPPRLADDLVEDGLVGEDARVALGPEDADGRGDDLVLGLGPRLGPARQREELAEVGAGADLVEARGADGAPDVDAEGGLAGEDVEEEGRDVGLALLDGAVARLGVGPRREGEEEEDGEAHAVVSGRCRGEGAGARGSQRRGITGAGGYLTGGCLTGPAHAGAALPGARSRARR